MTGKEWDNFYLSDPKEYILKNNQKFLEWYKQKQLEGFSFYLSIDDMQQMIYRIVEFYEFKFHNNMLNDMIRYPYKSEKYSNSQNIADLLTIDELKYRLHHDYRKFLDPVYPQFITISRESEDVWASNKVFLRIEDNGTINKYDLKKLEERNLIYSTYGVKTAEDLYSKCLRSSDSKLDYSNLENVLYRRQIAIELRNKILELIPLAIIYSGGPEYGYIRAEHFINTFNEEYDLNMTTAKINEIANRDYSKITLKLKTTSSDEKELPKRRIRVRMKKNNKKVIGDN